LLIASLFDSDGCSSDVVPGYVTPLPSGMQMIGSLGKEKYPSLVNWLMKQVDVDGFMSMTVRAY
jgi:hypothetical protein